MSTPPPRHKYSRWDYQDDRHVFSRWLKAKRPSKKYRWTETWHGGGVKILLEYYQPEGRWMQRRKPSNLPPLDVYIRRTSEREVVNYSEVEIIPPTPEVWQVLYADTRTLRSSRGWRWEIAHCLKELRHLVRLALAS